MYRYLYVRGTTSLCYWCVRRIPKHTQEELKNKVYPVFEDPFSTVDCFSRYSCTRLKIVRVTVYEGDYVSLEVCRVCGQPNIWETAGLLKRELLPAWATLAFVVLQTLTSPSLLTL